MNTLERISQIKQLWGMALPGVSVPEDRQLFLWARQFDDNLIEHAITRTSIKVRRDQH